MTEIGFYHLTHSGLVDALPRLLGRTLAANQRALVLCRDPARVAALDKALWEAKAPEWLPHGTSADGDADLQPIWLAAENEAPSEGAPNGARFLFLVDGADTASLAAFERVFDLFDGNEPSAVDAARTRWRAARQAGHTLAYWQQGPSGWEKKA